MVEIFPSLAMDGAIKIESQALRSKSPLPPMPFIRFTPATCVELA
jgi:hypothetical protein